MARPHPVVGVAAELADRRGGRSHQPNVGVNLHHEGEELIPPEEGFDFDLHAGVLLAELPPQRRDVLARDALILLLRGDRGDVAKDLGRHVADLADEAYLKPRSRQLLGLRHGPETILEIVVLHGRELLDRTVTAVMVREEQSLGRDDLPGAAASEDDDGILERGFVDAVNLLGREFAAPLLHLFDVHFLKVGQQPHSFVGRSGQRHACRRDQ